jgi:dUTP pyrophosphatase
MEKEDVEGYIKKLEELEKTIGAEGDNDDDGVDLNFMTELNELLGKLQEDFSVPSNDQPNIFTTQNTMKEGVLKEGVLVKVKKLVPEAVVPSYSKVGDAGMDLTITREIENTTFSVSYGFGIAMEIPKGYVGLVFPRSSVRNTDLILSNCVGVIDSGYRGEIQATFKKTSGLDSIKYKVGERGAQIIILPYPTIYMTEVPELSDTERGSGGFGSTGK